MFPAGDTHQGERGELSGGQTDSIRGVDPQQVVGCHVQVMVTMGGGKHTHLNIQVKQLAPHVKLKFYDMAEV